MKPSLGSIPLQKLHALHVERYYAESKLSPATLRVHHAILGSALKAAKKKKMVRDNVADDVANKPDGSTVSTDVLKNVWKVDEARRFVKTVKARGSTQEAAFFALALDSGARKSELLGLQWRDLDGNKLNIERQLFTGGSAEPTFIPPKRGSVRTVDLSDETVRLLQFHKRKQSELKMKNRTAYEDHHLMFAQAWEHIHSKHARLGGALNPYSINRRLIELCGDAKVRVIKVHGLRHTCATLSLAAGVPPHVVQKRLGHTKVSLTLNICGHVLPSMQEDAASRLATLLHG